MQDKYARAYTEVIELLNCSPEEEYSKIPVEKIKFYENWKNTYTTMYDIGEITHVTKYESRRDYNIRSGALLVCHFLYSEA